MRLYLLLKQATRAYIKKGAKKYRKAQVRRMSKFVKFAQNRGATHWGQIGHRTWIAFEKEFNFSDSNKKLYLRAIHQLEKLINMNLI